MDYSKLQVPNTKWMEGNCSECDATSSLRIVEFYNNKEQCWENDFVICLHCGKESTCN